MMTTQLKFDHVFASTIPDVIEARKLYVSLPYNVAVHKCACGCGEEVVTPISPSGWKVIYDGETISLHPSIGNWSYRCRSHYWVKGNRIIWAESWTEEQIKKTREGSRKEAENRTNGKKKGLLDRFISSLLK
ncbi:DUF6527 family protein [Paenibacillus alginolyticus]|uniref:DUF6527 family protein n=1 Tax=Paenibacillus alginolyticus TaxID=59839 RepID=UPI000492A459|nr:DUF6527 family protein [Paenibacillus alginolyticus]MCY9665763.1 DUF6527 family protein [Paenibacillus alginolyticus]